MAPHHSNHTASPAVNATAALSMITSSPSPPRPPPPTPADAFANWGPYSSSRAFFSNLATILIILACVFLVAFSIHAAARFLLRRLALRRAARARRAQLALANVPKPRTDAAAADCSVAAGAGAGVPLAGGLAEAECAICLEELANGERVRVLPACGHGFHWACVDEWIVARESCPICRAPSRPSPAGEP